MAISPHVIVLVLNEARNLSRCLGSIPSGLEVTVVDSGSTDESCLVAESLGASVVRNEWRSYSDQRNWALESCCAHSDWVLFLDADEAITAAFEDWLNTTVERGSEVFQLDSRIVLDERLLKHAPGYPIYHPRLVKSHVRFVRRRGSLEGVLPSYRHAICPVVAYEHHVMSHGLRAWMEKHLDLAFSIDYADDPAPTRRSRLSASPPARILGPSLRFLYHLIWRRGFLDGRPGLQYSLMYAWFEATVRLARIDPSARAVPTD